MTNTAPPVEPSEGPPDDRNDRSREVDDGAGTSGSATVPSSTTDIESRAGSAPIEALRAVMARLRDPERGCDWDVAQSFRTIAPYTIEEAYEVADAIERHDLDDLRDELGDLLLQVVFHARMAEEAGAFDLDDVARAIVAKMIRRHPHVFGDTTFDSDEARRAAWENAKAEERAAKSAREPRGEEASSNEPKRKRASLADGEAVVPPPRVSALDGVALALPALVRADKIQRRAARVGFDWPDVAPVRAKVEEELAEVADAAAAGDADALEDELGDLLFSAVNLARHHGVEPESALRRANAKFEHRFRRVEALAADELLALDELDLAALDALWERAKRDGRGSGGSPGHARTSTSLRP